MRILICGVLPLQLKVMQRVLEQDGHTVQILSGGMNSLQLVGRFVPDVLVTEILLPEMNGLEFVANVRQHYPSMLIVVLSVVRAERLIELAFRLGANDFIFKPFDPDMLSARIKRLFVESDSWLTRNLTNYVTSI
jgi:Response regulator containing CheY-like receiver, AAA-type ATPase, and DNA-binding domains